MSNRHEDTLLRNRARKIARLRRELKFYRSIHSSENIKITKAKLLEFGLKA